MSDARNTRYPVDKMEVYYYDEIRYYICEQEVDELDGDVTVALVVKHLKKVHNIDA